MEKFFIIFKDFRMLKLVLSISPVLFFMLSCTGTNVATMVGFTNTNPAQDYGEMAVLSKGGGIYHYNVTAGSIGNALARKQGKACSQSVLWLVAWGDSSLHAATESAGIKKIASVEYENQAIASFGFHKFCTVVWGE